MKNLVYVLAGFLLVMGVYFLLNKEEAMPKVKMTTSYGEIVIELDKENAPITTENFLSYVESGFYNETVFHRVISGFMIQGGGHLADMTPKDEKLDPIQNEANNGLKNNRGTIAMARTANPHSASSQFFINHADNAFLNFRTNQVDEGWGYAVFGQVIEGMEVVDKIADVETGSVGPYQDVPVEAITVLKTEVID
jgi:Peptidyl-prolyl cis-trans isomerase (rotamase) - cyclophilin family|tara:strand:+ start:78 stop:662 length:585 start_codon:yes stop_codon:yes gene_type:complete